MYDLTTTGALFAGPMIRWIALLPLVAAFVHGILIGLVRARISDRLVFGISVAAVFAALCLSMVGLYEIVGVGAAERLLDSVGPWIGGGVGPRSFSAELHWPGVSTRVRARGERARRGAEWLVRAPGGCARRGDECLTRASRTAPPIHRCVVRVCVLTTP